MDGAQIALSGSTKLFTQFIGDLYEFGSYRWRPSYQPTGQTPIIDAFVLKDFAQVTNKLVEQEKGPGSREVAGPWSADRERIAGEIYAWWA